MPGPVDYERGICYIKDQGKYDQLYGLNIKDLLAARLGIPPDHIRMMNDALCFLKGEIAGGAIKGCKSALGLTLRYRARICLVLSEQSGGCRSLAYAVQRRDSGRPALFRVGSFNGMRYSGAMKWPIQKRW